jgi:hypothetical protein
MACLLPLVAISFLRWLVRLHVGLRFRGAIQDLEFRPSKFWNLDPNATARVRRRPEPSDVESEGFSGVFNASSRDRWRDRGTGTAFARAPAMDLGSTP